MASLAQMIDAHLCLLISNALLEVSSISAVMRAITTLCYLCSLTLIFLVLLTIGLLQMSVMENNCAMLLGQLWEHV